jgi:pimeloyl-ACP methyl ester carboxylesterase
MEITLPDQVKLYFDKAGLGNPTFILIHGGGADNSHLAPQYYFFARRGTAINLDLRGYGRSDKPAKYGTIAQYADDVADLCRQLKITSPIIIGHSMGGMVAVELAAKHPMLASAIVLISSGVLFPSAALEGEEKVLRDLGSATYRTAIQALIDQICLPSDRFKSHVEETFFAIPQEQWVAHFEAMFAWDKVARERVSACKLPILYIADSGTCFSDLPLFSSLCPQLVIGKTVGSGHFATLELPDQVNSMIEDFVEAYSKKLTGSSSLPPTSS